MTRLTIRVIPNAKTSEVVGRELGVLKVKLAAPPIEGKANEELIRVLAEHFDIPKSLIHIVHGQSGKNKVVELP